MRIAVDGRNLLLPHLSGIGGYAAGLRAAYAAMGHTTEIIDQGPPRGRAAVWRRALRPWAASCPLDGERRLAPDAFRAAQVHFDVFGTPLRLTGPASPDLVHWTYPLPLHWPGVPSIVTVADLVPLLHPTLTGIDGRRMRRILAACLARASHVATLSEATRQDVIATFGVDPARVTNTWLSLHMPPPGPPPPLPAPEYYVFIGTVERRKNVRRLIEAHRASGAAAPLVIAGPEGWHGADELAGLVPGPGVFRIPWLERAALLGLLAGARALLFPSLAEGFGLPVAEAMALGVPVLTSHSGALAEIAGGAALLVDPLDVRDIARGIVALETLPALRARLAEAGPRQAARFSTEAHASRLAPALRAALLANPRHPARLRSAPWPAA